MTQRGASLRAAAAIYGIGTHQLRMLVREGLGTPHAVGRRSLVIFSELEAALARLPRPRSSKRSDGTRREPPCPHWRLNMSTSSAEPRR